MTKKHQHIVLLVMLVFGLTECKLQNEMQKINPGQATFMKYIFDEGNTRGVTVEETNDGGYILTGYTTGGEYGQEDLLLIKTNAEGNTIWRKVYGGPGSDNGWAVRQTLDGGYIVVGFTNSFGSGQMDVYLIKTNKDGVKEWSKTFGGKGEEYGWDVRVTRDKGYIIASQTNSFGNGEVDAYLIKVDSEGTEEWSSTYGAERTDRIFSVQETIEGGFISAGITYNYTSINSNDRDGYLLKVDETGKKEWHKTIGGDAFDVAHSIALTEDGGFFVTGYGESFAKFGNRDVYLIKTNPQGEEEMFKVIGGIGEERGIKGYQTADGGYIAIGITEENRDVYLVKITSLGEVSWTKSFGSPNKVDFGYTVRETKDGGFILIGHSEEFDRSKSQILLIKTDQEGNVKL
jgi:hypothetical protein